MTEPPCNFPITLGETTKQLSSSSHHRASLQFVDSILHLCHHHISDVDSVSVQATWRQRGAMDVPVELGKWLPVCSMGRLYIYLHLQM